MDADRRGVVGRCLRQRRRIKEAGGAASPFSKWPIIASFCLIAGIFPLLGKSLPEPYEVQIESRTEDNFRYAAVQCWLPANRKEVRGILCIVLHPDGMNGRILKSPEPWWDLASSHGFALVGASFVEPADPTKYWFQANRGSGRALLKALDELADQSGLSALRKSPILIAGVCAAGQFAYEFAGFAPDRIAAFVTIGGGKHDIGLAAKAATTPGLLIAAPDRGDWAVENMLSLFSEGRKSSAPWALSLERIKEYDAGKSSNLTARFLASVMTYIRKARKVDWGTGDTVILPLDRLSETRAGTLIKRLADGGLTCCFPNQATAQTWLANNTEYSMVPSFLGVALPVRGTTQPRIELGRIDLAPDGSGTATVKVDISCLPGMADAVAVPAVERLRTESQISSIGQSKWRARCRLNLTGLPSGAFTTDLPVRFLKDGKLMLGGLTTLLSGTIVGDVQVTPRAITFGSIRIGEYRSVKIKLASQSNTPIKISKIESDLPDWIAAKVKTDGHSTVEIQCDAQPPLQSSKKQFGGYLTIKLKSTYEQKVRLFCFGSILEI